MLYERDYLSEEEKKFIRVIRTNWDVAHRSADRDDAAHACISALQAIASLGDPYKIVGLMQAGINNILSSALEDSDE